jgi:hypothetical protein
MTPRMVEDRHWTGSGPENLTVDPSTVDLPSTKIMMDVLQQLYVISHIGPLDAWGTGECAPQGDGRPAHVGSS